MGQVSCTSQKQKRSSTCRSPISQKLKSNFVMVEQENSQNSQEQNTVLKGKKGQKKLKSLVDDSDSESYTNNPLGIKYNMHICIDDDEETIENSDNLSQNRNSPIQSNLKRKNNKQQIQQSQRFNERDFELQGGIQNQQINQHSDNQSSYQMKKRMQNLCEQQQQFNKQNSLYNSQREKEVPKWIHPRIRAIKQEYFEFQKMYPDFNKQQQKII